MVEMPKTKNIPAEEEILGMMTPEEREASETRAKNWEQDVLISWDASDRFDENMERRKLSREEKEKLENVLVDVGKLFKDSGLKWKLDGAINISLMRGEFIGMHKDIDISFEEDEMQKLDEHLLEKGYGLFVFRFNEDDAKNVLRRVGADDAKSYSYMRGRVVIVAINESGKIDYNEETNFIDVHMIERDQDGKAIGRVMIPLPEKWLEPKVIDFRGEKLNLSSAASIVYYKLYEGRYYDMNDLQKLAETGELKAEEIEEVQNLLEKESENAKMIGARVFEEIGKGIGPEMTIDEIMDFFSKHPMFQERVIHQKEIMIELAEKFKESKDLSGENLFNLAKEVFGTSDRWGKMMENLEQVKKWVIEKSEN